MKSKRVTGPKFVSLETAPPSLISSLPNDLVLFAKATNKNFTTINRVLRTFSDISGQKINFNKSRLVLSKRTDPTCATHIKNALDIRLSNHFGKYLGTPILVDGRDKKDFEFLLEKIQDRLMS